MQSLPDDHVDYRDTEWARAVDNAIVLLSLLIAKSQLAKAIYPQPIKRALAKRLDSLIRRYRDPNV